MICINSVNFMHMSSVIFTEASVNVTLSEAAFPGMEVSACSGHDLAGPL